MRSLRTLAYALIVLALGMPGTASAGDPPPPVGPYLTPQTQVRLPDGRNYNLVCMGQGSPVAILDASLSTWSMAFRGIQPKLAGITRVCAVDRAGFGFSDPGPLPRDAAAEVGDLEEALDIAHIAAPYVLVGHSLGGQEMRLYAYRHPEKVAGLLLIDPGIEHTDRRLPYPPGYGRKAQEFFAYCAQQARAGKLVAGYLRPGDEGPCVPPSYAQRPQAEKDRLFWMWTQPGHFEATVSEFESFNGRTSNELDLARRSLGSIPLLVLSSDREHYTEDRPPGVDADALYSAWIKAHDDLARDSIRGEDRIIDGASHFIFQERPDAVLSAFGEVIATARASGKTAASRVAEGSGRRPKVANGSGPALARVR